MTDINDLVIKSRAWTVIHKDELNNKNIKVKPQDLVETKDEAMSMANTYNSHVSGDNAFVVIPVDMSVKLLIPQTNGRSQSKTNLRIGE